MKAGRLLAAVVLVAVCMVITPSASAAAASITQIGWWSQRPGASAQPDGGFELAFAPNDQLSIAAVRIEVDAVQLTSALLSITETQAFGSEVAAISACPTTDSWSPANPGAWDDRPTPNCNRTAPFSRRNTGEWTGDVRSLLTVGANSIVLVPGSHEDTQGAPVPYQLTFEKPSLLATAPTQAPSGSPNAGAPGSIQGPTVIAAPGLPPTTQSGGPPPIAVAPGPTSSPAGEPPFAATPASGDQPGEPKPWWRLAIIVPLALAVGAGSMFARRFALARGIGEA